MDVVQWALLAAGLAAAGWLLFFVVRWMKSVDAIFPDLARDYGLAAGEEKQGSAFTNLRQSRTLQGSVQGVPLQAAATYQTRGRLRMRSTWVATRAPVGVGPCTINLPGQRPASELHLQPTGDPRFDAVRWVASDAPEAVRALLTAEVRACLLGCPQPELRLVVADGHLVLSFPGTPSKRVELEAPMKVVLALARAGGA